MLAGLLILPPLTSGEVTDYTFTSVLSRFVEIMPLALAVGLVMIIGEFDVSSVAIFGLAAMLAVKVGEESILLGVLVAGAVGVLAGALQGGIVAAFAINSVPVTLGGFLLLWGATNMIGGGTDAVLTSLTVSQDLTRPVVSVAPLSAIIVVLIVLASDALLRFTRVGTDLRAIGGDRRASLVVGLRVNRLIVYVFAAAGLAAGLGGALNAYSVGGAPATVSFAPLVTAVIAAAIGGAGMGTSATILGIASGVMALALLQETMSVIGADPNVVTLINAGFLAAVALLSAPGVVRLLGSARAGSRSEMARMAPLRSLTVWFVAGSP